MLGVCSQFQFYSEETFIWRSQSDFKTYHFVPASFVVLLSYFSPFMQISQIFLILKFMGVCLAKSCIPNTVVLLRISPLDQRDLIQDTRFRQIILICNRTLSFGALLKYCGDGHGGSVTTWEEQVSILGFQKVQERVIKGQQR